jgi:RimJ/RimL family protein N-acetyltransferase
MYNPASGRVMEKNGMVREGILREHYALKDGRKTDSAYYGILKSDWAVSIKQ